MKLSFKKHQRTGRYRSFQKEETDIKGDKKLVGSMYETDKPNSAPENSFGCEWAIRLMVKATPDDLTKNPNCCFKNITLKGHHPSEAAARKWVQDHWQQILTTFQVHQIDD